MWLEVGFFDDDAGSGILIGYGVFSLMVSVAVRNGDDERRFSPEGYLR